MEQSKKEAKKALVRVFLRIFAIEILTDGFMDFALFFCLKAKIDRGEDDNDDEWSFTEKMEEKMEREGEEEEGDETEKKEGEEKED